MWLYLLCGVLATSQIDAKKKASPPVTEVEVKAGRSSPFMQCDATDKLSTITWFIGYQEGKSTVLEEKWENLPADRFVLTKDDSELQVKNTKYEDRSNIKCQFLRNVTKEEKLNGTLVNTTTSTTVANYFRLRVRDPNGAAWPTVGIAVEAVVLFIVITAFQYVAKNKSGSK